MNRSDNVSSLLDEATKHMNAGKFGRAFTLLKNLLATDPTHQEGRRLLATLLLKLGNPATAKNAFDSLLQQAFKHHNYVEAESLLKEYLSVGPRCAPFIEMLGEVYERKGDPIAAVIEYEKAIKILLEDPEPEGASHARELYEKIKALAPHSFVAGRLTEKFDAISLPPSDARPAAPPSFPLPPSVSPELPPITMLVSDSIEVPAPPPPTKGIADHQGSSILHDPPASADSTPSSPDIAQTTGSEEPVASGEPDVPPSQLSATVKAAPPDAFPPDAQEVLEKVPFPPVNQMPPSGVTEEVHLPEPLSASESVTPQEDHYVDRPFWDSVDEPVASSALPEENKNTSSSHSVTSGESNEPPPPQPISDPVFPSGSDLESSLPMSSEVPTQPTWKEIEGPLPTPPSELHQPVSSALDSHGDSLMLPESPTLAESPRRSIEADQSRSMQSSFKPFPRRQISWTRQLSVRISIFTARCVATAGSVTRLALLLFGSATALAVLGVGAMAILWGGLEEKPTELYEDLAKIKPSRLLQDPQTNGYLLLLGFDTSSQVNPVQVGYDRWLSPGTAIDETCIFPGTKEEETPAMAALFHASDPVSQFKREGARLNEWIASESVAMDRYRQWLGMTSDDWGYGYLGSPNCAYVLEIHRLFVADGFAQDSSKGLDRLETDLAVWRTMLAQAKTLSMKSMASEAVKDDIFVMSGLLSRPVLEYKVVQRLIRLARPLDSDERSLRWPMQNEFLLEAKRMESRLRARPETDSVLEMAVKRMPVPKQRTLNAYAKYYDALIKTPPTHGKLSPKLYDFAGTPARNRVDVFLNPLDNLLRTEPIPDWENWIGTILEIDARLRLAGLLARLRGSSEQQFLAKVGQAGPAFYDPFTELPMLLNMAQGRLYSVGRDGKDDGGEPTFDLSVSLLTK